MLKMKVFGLIAFLLSVVSAQLPLRFQSSGLQSSLGPLATSATRGRPFISIPIVLLPDGQAVQKPRHTNYEYAGKSEGRRNPRQNGPRTQNSQSPIISKPATNYQVAVPPTTTPRPSQKKHQKIPKLTQQQLSGQLKNVQSSPPKHNIPTQNFQQKQQTPRPVQQQHQQTQNVPHVQQIKQQRIPSNRNNSPNQQSIAAHKQNVVNFVSFAANLGATITSPQQSGQQQTPHQFRTETQYQPQQVNKPQGNFFSQKQASTNHRQNVAAISQAQVQTFPGVQHSYESQVVQNIPPVKQSNFLTYHQAQQSQNQHTQNIPSNVPSHYTETAPVSKQAPVEVNSQTNTHYQSASLPQNFNTATPFAGSHSSFGQGNSNSVPSLHTYQQNYAGSFANPQVILPQKSVINFEMHQQLPKSNLDTHSQSMSSDYMVNSPSVPVSYTNQNHGSQYNFMSNSQQQQNAFSNNAEAFPGTYAAAQNVASTIVPSQQNLESNLGSSNSQEQLSSYQSAQSITDSYLPSVNSGQSYSQIPDSSQTSYLGQGASESTHGSYNAQINQEQPQLSSTQQGLDSTYSILGNNQFLYSLGGQSIYSGQQQADTSSNQQSAAEVQTQESFAQEQPSYTVNGQQTQVNYLTSPQVDKNYQTPTYNYEVQSQQDEAESQTENQQTQSDTPSGDSQLIYASSAGKQINYSPSPYTYSSAPQQFSSSHLQSSPTYVSFTTSNSGLKSNSASTSTNYGNQPTGVITPGSSYAKLAAQSNISSPKQPESTSEQQQSEDDDEYEGEDEEEEASYKVVYIPLDILKNILSNSVETK